ncbi:MAG: hypothetical protein OSA89_00445 [Mariniblastus sp.]|nr:hypothetical protein [Mariniblastus sp.]
MDTETESSHVRLPGAIEFSFAEDCGFNESSFENFGGGAIYFGRQTNDCFLKSSHVEDVGGCGVMIGETLTRLDPEANSLVAQGNIISDTQCSSMRFHLAGENTLKPNQCFHKSNVEPLEFNNTPEGNIKNLDNVFVVEDRSSDQLEAGR